MLLAICGVGCGASSQETGAVSPAPEGLLLGLSDVPAGFRIGDDSACGPIGVGDGWSAALSEVVRRASADGPVVGCVRQLERVGATRMRLVVSAAISFPTEDLAVEAMGQLPSLASGFVLPGSTVRNGITISGLGAGARLLPASRVLVLGRTGGRASVASWRQGRVLSLTAVVGGATDKAAKALARVSYARRGVTVAPVAPDTDDREVALDLPGLGVPIWWLGRKTSSATTTRPLVLETSSGPLTTGQSPGFRVLIDYRPQVHIGLWRPAEWRAFPTSDLGQVFANPPCATHRTVNLADRRIDVITIPTGPPGPPTGPAGQPCGAGPERTSWAVVHLPGVVATVNLPICFSCATGTNDNADTIEQIARALHAR